MVQLSLDCVSLTLELSAYIFHCHSLETARNMTNLYNDIKHQHWALVSDMALIKSFCYGLGSASLRIDYPMLFEVHNPSTSRTSHCGVLEFVAEEGMVYMPYWVCSTVSYDLYHVFS